MDRLRKLTNGRGVAKGIAGFVIFSAAIFLVGLIIGVFDNNPSDEGGVSVTYKPPIGERRY